MTKISVIIPTWNRAETLGKAISSALNQTLQPFEIIVCGVNDSPDKEVFNSINDSRVRWIEGGKDGLASIPRNRGIKESRGEWLAFLDSDDEWLPDKLKKQLEYARNMNCDAVCSDAIRYIPSQGHVGTMVNGNVSEDSIPFSLLVVDNCIVCSSVLIKKELVEKCNGFPEDRTLKVGEDYALWLRIATLTNFAFVNEPLLIYRDEPQTSVRASCPPDWEIRINVLRSFIEWIVNKDLNQANKKYVSLSKKLLFYAYMKKLLHSLIRNVRLSLTK